MKEVDPKVSDIKDVLKRLDKADASEGSNGHSPSPEGHT